MKTNDNKRTEKRVISIIIALALTFLTNAAISYGGKNLSYDSGRLPDSVRPTAGDPIPLPPPPEPSR